MLATYCLATACLPVAMTSMKQGLQTMCGKWRALLLITIFLMGSSALDVVNHQVSENGLAEKVCRTIDIRNKPESFNQLRGCTVIEGSLQILLIDYADPSEYEDLYFPELREITDFLLLYRVYGLKTLSHILPNLSVIRGQNLFFNYALVAFEMPDFEELGLAGLTTIKRGAVRLEKNPNLCYVDTIKWDYMTKLQSDDNIIMQNKDIGECPNVCPLGDRCPVITVEYGRKQRLCWNTESCQKVCPDICRGRGLACYTYYKEDINDERVDCCHPECLGGCTGPEATDCFACKNVFYEGRCQKQCHYGTYKYLNRRCISEAECRARDPDPDHSWKVFEPEDGSGLVCVPDCPSGYITDKDDKNKCHKCDGLCPKICRGITIDSVAAAQKLKGCTVIHGILEIQIRGGSQGHIGRELEENLSKLEEVTHYVKIVRSYASVSLRFLKNLKVIHGERLHNDRYAMFVLDNQNLVDIWNFSTHPTLTIKRGKVFFMFNRKLCLDKIYKLVELVGLKNDTSHEDVDPNTNGDQMACDTTHLKLELVSVLEEYAVIRWNNFFTADHRELLNWVVYYREAKEQNITIFNARDACGSDGWKTDDIAPDNDKEAPYMASILHNLKPATQYAVYVQTYTVSTANRGAISSIVYFTTNTSTPSPVRDIRIAAKNVGELHVSWKPPSKPNGNVTHYYVYWQAQSLSMAKFDMRNYCIDKLRMPGDKKTEIATEKKNQTINGECCACPKSKEEERLEEEDRMMQIEFENFLQNVVYVKRPIKTGPYMAIPLDDDDEDYGYDYADFYGPLSSYDDSMDEVEEKVEGEEGENGSLREERSTRRRRRQLFPHDLLGYNHTLAIYRNGTTPAPQNDSLLANMTGDFNVSQYNVSKYNQSGTGDDENNYKGVVVYNKLEVVLTNLKHFQEYNIEIIACHDRLEGKAEKYCSNRAITTARTLPEWTGDTVYVPNITVSNVTSKERVIWIKWLDPENPNGIIITYDIELLKTDVTNYKADVYCIPHIEYRKFGGYITHPLNPGNWSFRIRATSLAGNGSWTPTQHFYVAHFDEDLGIPLGLTVGLPLAVLLLLAIIATSVGVVYVTKRRNELPQGLLYTSVNPEYWSGSEVYIQDHWELERDKIEIIHELGQGSFGMVYEGVAKDIEGYPPSVKVAVKTVNEKASLRDRIEFLNEASVMKAFTCQHVVRLIGVVSRGQPTLVVMELMANGDLKSFLRLHRPDYEENDGRKPPSLKEILQMTGEIADGMAYLAAKKYVHRDLAARNCMVSEHNVVKIGDFGMTRDIYETDYYRKGGKGLLPVRWMSPESLKDGIFTSQSDVWSYGVVVWEMATLAAQPYQGLANEQVLKFVIDGNMMEKPEGCPDRLYELMLLCWQYNPKNRPTFCEVIEMLIPDLSLDFNDVSFFFSEENQESMATTSGVAEEGELEDVDIHTPLTGSPLHQPHHSSIGEVSAASLKYTHEDSMSIGEQSESVASSLSYQSPVKTPSLRRFHLEDVGGGGEQPYLEHRQYSSDSASSDREDLNQEPQTNADRRKAFFQNDDSSANSASQWKTGDEGRLPYLHTNEGSKESSKSSGSSHGGGRNGLSNGHIPHHHIPPHSRAECC